MLDETELCDREIRELADQVVDLGVSIEELFKNAISLLFTRDWSGVIALFQSPPDVAPVTLVSTAFNLINKWPLSPDRLRTVMALHEAASEFATIRDIIERVANKASAFDDDIETYLIAYVGRQGHQAFFQLVHSAYVQLRGCVVALSTRQASIAENVIQQDIVLDQAFLQLRALVQDALSVNMDATLPLGLISVVIGDIEQLGNHVTRICQGIRSITQGALPVISDDSLAG
jgi:phosphate uptake regulator